MGWTLLYAFVVLFGLFLGFAGAGALLWTWSVGPRLYSLESRISEVEQDLIHEVKKRAGRERAIKHDVEEGILEEVNARKNAGQASLPWYEQFVHPDLKR